jgi:hypothetical protein
MSGPIDFRMPTIRQSQPLQDIPRDEDPQYGPLARAEKRVTRARAVDDELTVDLADALGAVRNQPIGRLAGRGGGRRRVGAWAWAS